MRNSITTLIAFILFSLCANAQSETVIGAIDVYSDVEVTITVADKQYTVAAGELQGINLYAYTNTLRIVPSDGNKGAYSKTITLERKGERAFLEINIMERRRKLDPPLNMVMIIGGGFQMGDTFGESKDVEKPVHTVGVDAFLMGIYEVTFNEYDSFCDATKREKPDDHVWGRGRKPVINVDWCDAVEYANWLSNQDGLQKVYSGDCDSLRANWNANGYRLPTEAEWEYAAREGGKRIRFGNGENIANPSKMNYDGSWELNENDYYIKGVNRERTVVVGSLNSPNVLGLNDMSGNVWEWCWDLTGGGRGDYEKSSASGRNPRSYGHNDGYRIMRGVSWRNSPPNIRCSKRAADFDSRKDSNIGFRIARTK